MEDVDAHRWEDEEDESKTRRIVPGTLWVNSMTTATTMAIEEKFRVDEEGERTSGGSSRRKWGKEILIERVGRMGLGGGGGGSGGGDAEGGSSSSAAGAATTTTTTTTTEKEEGGGGDYDDDWRKSTKQRTPPSPNRRGRGRRGGTMAAEEENSNALGSVTTLSRRGGLGKAAAD